MTWIKFIIWLCGLYIFYYLVVIIWDALKNRSNQPGAIRHELTFSEDIKPALAAFEPDEADDANPVIFSGGVSLKQLFNLAREEAIEYTRPVSFML